MDIKDVSGFGSYREFFDQLKHNAARGMSRKGEVPQDHPHPGLLVGRFMARLDRAGIISTKHNHTISTSQVPPPYPPCARPLQELMPMMISRMALEYHHRGKQVLIRVLTPPDRMTAVMAVVEDEEGTAVLIQLYNQPEESEVSKEQILRAGDLCVVKEPYFKVTTDGQYSLRVDHVSDIIWLDDTDERIPLMWRTRILNLEANSHEIRKEGNVAVQARNWAQAERLYSQAISTAISADEGKLAHLNRSLANLRLGRSEKALNDAMKSSIGDDAPSEKALYREAKALYSLGKFKSCMDKLLALVRCNPTNSEAWNEIKRVKQRLYEEETGSYKFSDMYKQAKETPPLIDCATYVGPVAVRHSPDRGKGLFTTRPVKAGDLLLCEKAFAYSYADNDSDFGRSKITMLMDMSTMTGSIGGQAHLIPQIIQKVYHNPASAEIFTDLYHGDYPRVEVSQVDNAPIVDTFLTTKIIQLNSFGSPRSTYQSMTIATRQGDENPTEHTTCGIWPLASRINHSCVTNCRRSFIGDMQIVRACQDLDADTELCFLYKAPLRYQTYQETQKSLSNWGFVCRCLLCLDKKTTPRSVTRNRKALVERLKAVLNPAASTPQPARAKTLLAELEKTYTPWQDAPLVPRLELLYPFFRLGEEFLARNKPMKGLEMIIKGLESLTFSIVACPPMEVTDESNQKRVTLEITRWGQVNDCVPAMFMRMVDAYEKLAPELCKIAEEYAKIACSICFGEQEAFGKLNPQVLWGTRL
ncbi:TPR domain protein [Xylariaceae sp. FL0016]|nr:TPR domain protein [Xylariaceae sp. FL0016]